MKVLFCALKNEYGDPKRGRSWESKTFFDTLSNMHGVEAEHFPMDEIMRQVGRDEMNSRLLREVREKKPDLLFCFLFTEEIKKETIRYITRNTTTKTFNWFGDDHWRVPVYSRFWAPLFTIVSTTDSKAMEAYKSLGISNVIKTQWGANPFLYKPEDLNADAGKFNITFLGQKYGKRLAYIDALKAEGLPAEGWGTGWPTGGVFDPKDIRSLYAHSKINLNFSETPYYGFKKKLNLFAKLFIKKELGRYKLNIHHPISNIKALIGTQRLTIKGRVFEVLACGGFLLTGKCDDDLGEYYQLGKEVVEFKGIDDLVDKCKYYLEHETERKAIAKAGYERTIRDHTYSHRFHQIFKALHLA